MPETDTKKVETPNKDADDALVSTYLTPSEQIWDKVKAVDARKDLVHDYQSFNDRIEAEKRPPTAEERQSFDRMWSRIQALGVVAKRRTEQEERAQAINSFLSESKGRVVKPDTKPGAYNDPDRDCFAANDFIVSMDRGRFARLSEGLAPGTPTDSRRVSLEKGGPAWARHSQPYLRAVRDFWTGQLNTQQARIASVQYAQQYDQRYGTNFQAALQTDLGTGGGYMVMPEQFVAELLMNVDDLRFLRKLSRVFQLQPGFQTLGVVKRTAKMATFAWGAEISPPTADSTLAFGKRSLTPHYMAGLILISRDLLRSAMLPVDEIVRYEIARDSGELEENGFLTGSGAQQPLGVFTASAEGIDTSRDVSTSNTTTAITADNLVTMKYTLKAQYLADPSLAWVFSRTAISQIAKLKDGDGRYLWAPGLTAAQPDTILNIPFYMSEFAPSTFTTGLYVGILGAWRFYWIADSLDMDMQQLSELYALSNQIAFVARRKVDAQPQIAEAFCRCKLA